MNEVFSPASSGMITLAARGMITQALLSFPGHGVTRVTSVASMDKQLCHGYISGFETGGGSKVQCILR